MTRVFWPGLPSGRGVNQIRGAASALDRVEYLTLDWRFLLAGARPAPDGVVIVAIDYETALSGGGAPSRMSLALAEFEPRRRARHRVRGPEGRRDRRRTH